MFIGNKPSILIIDGDTAILHVFSRIFQRKGYSVTVAEKGREAIEKISCNHYDDALIDLRLADMEGTELFPLIQSTYARNVEDYAYGQNYSASQHRRRRRAS